MQNEKFVFTAGAKKNLMILGIIGLVVLALGVLMLNLGGHDHHDAAGHDDGHHAFHWTHRLFAGLWINNVYFIGIAVIGVFFFALQYAAQAGWSAGFKRIPLVFGSWLPIGGALLLGTFLVANHDLFHWTHSELYDPNSPEYDYILDGKKGYLNVPFYLIRMVAFLFLWALFYKLLQKGATAEDEIQGSQQWFKMRRLSAIFLVVFAVTSSIAAWDWVMSIDSHWFSTLFGWYMFASWFVTGLAFTTLLIMILRDHGYLPMVNQNHLHDLGKFVFAFSIFWTYTWVSQYLLIYYSNIPEETVYFAERMQSETYKPVFYVNLIVNFFFPFLVLMTRDAKRHTVFLKLVCAVVMIGHWIDFYQMITPGTLGANGGFGLLEIGLIMVYSAAFLYVILGALSKIQMVPKNHPMLQESVHHHI
jgi:hypothetical protein